MIVSSFVRLPAVVRRAPASAPCPRRARCRRCRPTAPASRWPWRRPRSGSAAAAGRRSRAPAARLTPLNLATKIVLGPSCADAVAQRLVEAADERRHADDRRDADDDAEDRQRRAQLVGAQRVERHAARLRAAAGAIYSRLQRLDGIQARRARCRIQAEEQADRRGDADAERDRPRLEPRRQRRDARR